jgi:hypothetical protein
MALMREYLLADTADPGSPTRPIPAEPTVRASPSPWRHRHVTAKPTKDP